MPMGWRRNKKISKSFGEMNKKVLLMRRTRFTILISLLLFLFFHNILYSQGNVIQICTVRNENEEGIKELKELSRKMIAHDPRYRNHKDKLLSSCNYLGIFGEDHPPPEFPSIYEYDSMSDVDKLKIAKELVQGNISAVLIIGDLRADLVSIIWGEICEAHNADKSKFLAISFVTIPEEVVEKMNEYMRTEWYEPYEIPSYEYFTYRRIDTARIIAVPPTAGGRGSVIGSITDPDASSLPGVTVTVTGSSLEEKMSVVTGENGLYRIIGLPAGIYTIRAEIPGFKATEFEKIRIQKGTSKKLNFVMEMASIEEEITIVGESPTVDIKKTAISTSLTQYKLEELPTARDPWVMLTSMRTGGEQASAENLYFKEGFLTYEFLKSVEVGGYEAEYRGLLGSMVADITRTGGNRLQGDFSLYFTLKNLTEKSPTTYRAGSFLGNDEYDLRFNFGGPIIKDKLWFFSWYAPNWLNNDYETLTNISTPEQLFTQYYGGRLRWQIHPHHRLSFGLSGNREIWNDINQSMNVLEPVRYDKIHDSWNIYSSYEFIINDNIFLNTKISFQQNHNEYNPEKNIPFYEDGTSDGEFSQGYGSRIYFGGTSFSGWDKKNRLNGKIGFSWYVDDFVGNHEFKFGAEFIQEIYKAFIHPNGPGEDVFGRQLGVYWRIRDWGYYNRYNVQDSQGDMDELSFFAQDTWSTSRFNLNLGLRITQNIYKGYGESAEKIRLGFNKAIAPRVEFDWDIKGDSKIMFYGRYGKFYEPIPLSIISRILSHEQHDFYFYNLPTNNQLPSWDNPGLPKYGLYDNGVLHIAKNIYFTDFNCQYTHEAILGIKFELFKDIHMRLRGIYRSLENAVGGVSFDEGVTITLTNPSGFQGIDSNTEMPIVFPELERKFVGLEFTAYKRFSNNYQFFIFYLLSKDEGNTSGPFYQMRRESILDITSLFYLPELLENAYGPLDYDRTHKLKLSGSFRFKFGLVIRGYLDYFSGFPISKLGEHPSYGTEKMFLEKKGSAGRSSPFFSFDLFFEYPIKFDTKTLNIMLDIFNLTNHNSPLRIDQEWNWGIYPSDPSAQTNLFWGHPLLYQSPRIIRFGLRFSF